MSTCGLPLAIRMLEQLRKMDELNWKARMDGAHAALDIDSKYLYAFDPALRLSMMQDLMRNTMEAALRPIMHEIL